MFSSGLKFVKSFSLVGTPLSDDNIKALTTADWKYLRRLDLTFIALTNRQIALLMKGKWTELKKLHIDS